MAYFKYKNVTDILRQHILTGHYLSGEKLPTETQLCHEFSVSRRTIRTALAYLSQEGFLHIQQGSGAYVAQWAHQNKTSPSQQTRNIALILTDVETYIYPAVLKGINSELINAGYGLTLYITEHSVFKEAKVIESLLQANVDAVIIDPAKAALTNVNYPLYQKLADKMPCLTIHAKLAGLNIPAITMADTLCFAEMTRHVLSRGHTQLAGLFCYDEISGTERFKGFVQTLRAANLTLEERNILWLSRAQLSMPELERILDEFITKNADRTAFLSVNDRIAALLSYCLEKRGLTVPDQVSVTGFDNAPIVGTNITTLAHPQEQMGIRAVHAILERITNPQAKVEYAYPPQLIDRGSVALIKPN